MFSSFIRRRSGLAVALSVSAFAGRHYGSDASCASTANVQAKKIVVIGGGTAGIGVSAMLGNEGYTNVSVIEPSDKHYYQPIWSLVGGGLSDNSVSVRPMKDIFPKSATWIQGAAAKIDPAASTVTLADGSTVGYDYLVVATGVELNWNAVPGMEAALADEHSGVVSIYNYENAAKTRRAVEAFTEGRALFTMPATPVKCPGAPQKIMWLFEEHMRDQGRRADASVEYWVPGGAMFGVPRYSEMLAKLAQERGVVTRFKRVLVAIDGSKKRATFKDADTGELSEESYALLHCVPAMAPPAVVKSSGLANAAGFVEVNQHTLQSTKHANVFALGDCTTTPNSKTAAAITAQAPVLVHNLGRAMRGEAPDAQYNGYASCPLVVSKKAVILAEFGYGGKIMETFNGDTGVFPYSLIGQPGGAVTQQFFFWMKEKMFPYVYWNLWTKGKWFGTSGPFKPNLVLAKDQDKGNDKDKGQAK